MVYNKHIDKYLCVKMLICVCKLIGILVNSLQEIILLFLCNISTYERRSEMGFNDYALICKALGDATRVKIFDLLKSGKKCACKLLEEFNCTQPTLSYHMKQLVDCGIVISEKDGKWCYYRIDDVVLKKFSQMFLTDESDNNNNLGGCCD